MNVLLRQVVRPAFAFLLSLSLILASCGEQVPSAAIPATPGAPGLPSAVDFPSDPDAQLSEAPTAFRLQVLHASDLEAGVAAIQDAPNFSAVLEALRQDSSIDPEFRNNTLTLSSGDNYIPSPFFVAAADPAIPSAFGGAAGRADIAMINAMGFQAAAFGNHEFDLGPGQIASLIGASGDYPGASFPYLSANIDFMNDGALGGRVTGDGQEASTIPGEIARTAVITVGGEQIGLVGATTTRLGNISSPGPNISVLGSVDGSDQVDAGVIQQSVDDLRASGINKIILLAHLQQLRNETGDIGANNGLAEQLRDVDIIIAGGSHLPVANADDPLRTGDERFGDHPILRVSASGEPVAVVNTGANYSYVGRLLAEFDGEGLLTGFDLNNGGAFATDDAGVAAVGGTPNPTVSNIAQTIGALINEKDGQVFGQTSVYLNGLRNEVRTEETNLGNASADANIFAVVQEESLGLPVVSLKNGGGIRDSIGAIDGAGGESESAGERIPPVANPSAGKPEGGISQLDIENSLRFNNGLSAITVTAEELRLILEHGVSTVAPGATPGQFPQIGGMAFSFDPNGTALELGDNAVVLTPGNRVRTVVLIDENDNPTETLVANGVTIDPDREIRLVTLDFLANEGSTPGLGGDRYPFPAFGENRVDLNLGEQEAFGSFIQSLGTFTQADTPVEQDERIQNLGARSDSLA